MTVSMPSLFSLRNQNNVDMTEELRVTACLALVLAGLSGLYKKVPYSGWVLSYGLLYLLTVL